ncbi:MAG: Rrf2 family transcriptional regulator [Candidatus Omnitrophica bacterium]|nr:Rrf2 family transcriptional regulator [Candidatus Omnitrophota bacterium]
MKLITKNTDYAIRALGCIAKSKDTIITVSGLAESLDMPQSFLRKILQRLNAKGILKSSKGKGGGFALNINPAKISVLQLVEIFQGEFKLSEHVFKGKICPVIKICYFKSRLDMIEKDVKKQLHLITIKKITNQDNLQRKK